MFTEQPSKIGTMQYRPGSRPPDGINAPIESPLKDALILTAFTGVVVLAGYFVLSQVIEYSAQHLSLDKEIRYFQKDFVLDPSEDEKRIQNLVDRLWSHYPESEENGIHSSINKSKQINAFMMVGGNMSVTQGLLDKLETENELAFVICHEIGHLYHRDVINGLGRQVGLAVIMSLAGLGDNIDILNTGAASLSLAFSRGQESQADAFALECMQNEFGHVRGYDGFFKIVLKNEKVIPELGRKVLSFTQTHPMTEDRIKNLEEIIQKKSLSIDGKLTPL